MKTSSQALVITAAIAACLTVGAIQTGNGFFVVGAIYFVLCVVLALLDATKPKDAP